jgi:hypothetical protein
MREHTHMRPATRAEAPNGARGKCREAKAADAAARRLRA